MSEFEDMQAAMDEHIDQHAFPVIGALRPADIETDLDLRAQEPIRLTRNEPASCVRGRIESKQDWAKVSGLRPGKIRLAGAATLTIYDRLHRRLKVSGLRVAALDQA
jgi:hypothetical protein